MRYSEIEIETATGEALIMISVNNRNGEKNMKQLKDMKYEIVTME